MLRITRAQYDNIARDLLGATFAPSSALSTDEREGPFAVNSAARMSRGLAEQYQFVAERLATDAAASVQTVAPCADATRDAEGCAGTFIARFGRRAFRRPLAPDEQTRWRELYRTAAQDGGYPAGVRTVVEAMLQSPNFLFRLELLPAGTPADTAQPYAIDAFALASRLAFFLWNSPPDDALLDAATRGDLATPAGLEAQADRMLGDDRAARTTAAFAVAWAGITDLDEAATPERLEGLDPSLVPLMRDETTRFVDDVLRRGDGRLATLVTASFTLADPRLASAVYGAGTAAPDAAGRTALDPLQRAGVLTQPGVLLAHSHAGQTSPVLRGKWVREVLFCQPVPDPPPNVNASPPAIQPGLTTRERYRAHRVDPSCSVCHSRLDDIGFGFESYDPVGRYRATENGRTVDSSGTLSNTDVDGTFDGAPDLGRRLAQSEMAATCFARQWFRFGLGHADAAGDAPVLREMAAATRTEGGFRALVRALVRSDIFLRRRSP
jgi:hypothetical protein